MTRMHYFASAALLSSFITGVGGVAGWIAYVALVVVGIHGLRADLSEMGRW